LGKREYKEYEWEITKTVTASVIIVATSMEEAEAMFDSGDWESEDDIDCSVEDSVFIEETKI
jgi:hypothetical protein